MRTHFIFLTLLVAIYAQSEFEGDQVLRITPRDEKQVSLVMSLEDQEHLKLDIWRRPVKSDLIIDVHVPENSLQSFKVFLEYNDIQYSVMIEDLQVMIDNEKAELEQMTMMERSTSSFNYGKYHTLNEFSTGGTGRPAIWIDSGIHAREWVSPASAIWMAKKGRNFAILTWSGLHVTPDPSNMISSDYGQEPFITSLLRKMDIYMEIVVNPDGYVYTHTKMIKILIVGFREDSDRRKEMRTRFGEAIPELVTQVAEVVANNQQLWRKTRSTRPGRKCVGVDANRNFDAGFGGPGTSSNPCMETYRGPYPNSEHEVAAIVNFVQSHRNIKSFITIHSYSQLLMFPFGYKCVPPANYQELDALAKSAVSSLATLYGTRYKIGSICEAI
eukprot:g46840.t1